MNNSQGLPLRVLFVCSYGLLRSPTAAHWATAHKGWNTRSAGTSSAAVPQLEANLLMWAERIYVMEQEHADWIALAFGDYKHKQKILNVPDQFAYMDSKLVRIIGALLEGE
jgi:predicted protein tyrosine phosphatase